MWLNFLIIQPLGQGLWIVMHIKGLYVIKVVLLKSKYWKSIKKVLKSIKKVLKVK